MVLRSQESGDHWELCPLRPASLSARIFSFLGSQRPQPVPPALRPFALEDIETFDLSPRTRSDGGSSPKGPGRHYGSTGVARDGGAVSLGACGEKVARHYGCRVVQLTLVLPDKRDRQLRRSEKSPAYWAGSSRALEASDSSRAALLAAVYDSHVTWARRPPP